MENFTSIFMTLLIFTIVAVLIFSTFSQYRDSSKGQDALTSLKEGMYGNFSISAIDNQLEQVLAFDGSRRKIAFVNTEIPTFSKNGLTKTGYYNKTVVCSYDDIDSICLSISESTKSVVDAQFEMKHEIPDGNTRKLLSHIGDSDRIPNLLKQELPNIPIRTVMDKY